MESNGGGEIMRGVRRREAVDRSIGPLARQGWLLFRIMRPREAALLDFMARARQEWLAMGLDRG